MFSSACYSRITRAEYNLIVHVISFIIFKDHQPTAQQIPHRIGKITSWGIIIPSLFLLSLDMVKLILKYTIVYNPFSKHHVGSTYATHYITENMI